MVRTVASITLACVLAMSPAAALAMGKGNGRGHSNAPFGGNAGGHGGGGSSAVVPAINQTIAALTAVERGIIANYFRTNYSSLPPGLAKRQSLPPGLQRQLARNGTLPPGLTRHRLPADLRARLPGRDGLEFLIVDNEVVLVAAATLVIVDVLFDVF